MVALPFWSQKSLGSQLGLGHRPPRPLGRVTSPLPATKQLGHLLHQGRGVGGGRLLDSCLSTLLPDPCLVLSLCGPTVSRCRFLEWQGTEQCWEWGVAGGLS